MPRSIAIAAALLLAFACAAVGAEKTYLDCVDDALAAVEEGKTTDALGSLRQALAINANDPLAHAALGLALLEGGRGEEGRNEFAIAAGLDPDSAEALYGLGLVCLKKADLSGAARYFVQAQQARPDLSMQGSIGYVKWLAGGAFEPSASGDQDEPAQAMRAIALAKNGDYGGAQAIWSELQKKAVRPGFGERLGCSMSFAKTAPVAVAGWPVGRSYRPVTAARSKMTVVAGNLELKADLSRALNVTLVSFFVDGHFVGMTNTYPFHYVWDTRQTPNGQHTIKIQGSDASGSVVSGKSADILVRNKGVTPSGKIGGSEADTVRDRLWRCLALKASAAAINYNLALCDARLGDNVGAKIALERCVAADPAYLDAVERLSALYRPSSRYIRLYEGSGAGKTIALTFDDGPKKDTGRILDILKSKGVRATFFVVGKQADIYPRFVKRMAAEGHEIGDHTYNHRDLEYLTEAEITQEIFKTVATVRSLTGREIHFVRPPGGHEGTKLPKVMRRFGLTAAFWTANCSNLEGTKSRKIYEYAVSTAKPGGIILLHNMELCTVAALPDIIETLRARGYTFVTLSEMVNHGMTEGTEGTAKNVVQLEEKRAHECKYYSTATR